MKRILSICLFCAASASASAGGAPSDISSVSEGLGQASGVILLGSMSMIVGSGAVVVTSVEAVGDGIVVVLKGASSAGQASLRLTGKAAEGLSVAAGTVVKVVAVSTGHVLVLSGKAIAYIPNEIGTSLLHHSRVEAGV
ncbi:MAG: hypothetical protein V4754_05990 [Pseudomonadota bacterium]